MNIAHQFSEIAVGIAHDGLVAVLKEVPVTAVAYIVVDGVPCQQPAHELSETPGTAGKEQMGVVGQQGPGIHFGARGQGQLADSSDELSAV